MKRAAGAVVAGAVVLATLAPGRASASPEFPQVIESHLSLAYVPKCTICHATNDADAGPADTLFAASAVARGLKAHDDDSLRAALDAMAHDRVDSDGDRMRDIDELSWALDPNVRHVPQGDVAPPVTYGCSAAGATGGGGAWLVGVVAAICTLVRTRLVGPGIFAWLRSTFARETVSFAHFAAIFAWLAIPFARLLATFVRLPTTFAHSAAIFAWLAISFASLLATLVRLPATFARFAAIFAWLAIPFARLLATFARLPGGEAWLSPNDARSSPTDGRSSIHDARSSRGDAPSSITEPRDSTSEARSRVPEARCSTGEARSGRTESRPPEEHVRSSRSLARCSRSPRRLLMGEARGGRR